MESEGVRVTRHHDGIGRDTEKPKPCHKPATVPTSLLGVKGHTENKARPINTLLLAGVGLRL